MTSYFASHGTLSRETRDSAYCLLDPRNLNDRLIFYINYLQDVVPDGITVQHIPTGLSNPTSEEIQLITLEGYIFMSGLIRIDRNPARGEDIAGPKALNHYLDGEFVRDARDEQNWRFFTGHDSLRFFKSHGGDSWNKIQKYDPVIDAEYVAEYFMEEYQSIMGI